jgi:hypothetical protein
MNADAMKLALAKARQYREAKSDDVRVSEQAARYLAKGIDLARRRGLI